MQSCPPRNLRYCGYVISGNDFHIHAFLSEEFQGFPGMGTDGIFQYHGVQWPNPDWQRSAVRPYSSGISDDHDSTAFLHLLHQVLRHHVEHTLRRAHKHGPFRKTYASPFPL